MQLRGHLPELGETPALWVFTTAAAYDSFRVEKDVADVFPDSASLYMTFDKELLALYARGSDDGGRCLRAGSASTVSGSIVTLELSWDAASCGAPAGAHYPFVLASLSRTADDGSAWAAGRQICATAPGITGSTQCAPASGASPSPSFSPSPVPSASATFPPTPTPTAFVSRSPSPAQSSAAPTPTATAVATPARTSSPRATPTAVVAGSSDESGTLDLVLWLAVGVLVGGFLTAILLRRPRTYRV